ncbi:MAG: C39 family peptidase, partial [Candidatus Eisenbacteria bacterium]
GRIAGGAPASRYPAEYDIVSCPHYYQTTSYHCGPASLRMVFDYWEMSIGQMMIGRVSNCTDPYGTSGDDLRRAGHFSHLSTAIQDPTLHGYTQRPYGYASMECYWSGIHYDTRYSDLKELVSSDVPILPLMWYSASHASGHFRVVKGYSDPLDVFIVHDPWFAAPYQGPNVHFQQTFFVDDLWAYAGRWAMTSQPWEFQLSVPDTVSPDDQFDLATLITYPGPLRFEDQYPALAPAATIELSGGLTLAPGETATKVIPDLYASGSAGTVQWELIAPPDSGTAVVIVRATGLISGSSGSYPYYEDEIGGVDTCRIVIRTDPSAIPGDAAPTPAFTVLEPCRPNPFLAQTSVHLALARAEHVRISVHDPSGRLVNVLLEEDLHPGFHTIPWPGRDAAGNRAGPGVYYVRMQAGGVTLGERTVVLLR